jgi:hypothetical protein
MGGNRVCPEDCPLAVLVRAFDGRAKRLIDRRLSQPELNDAKDLELWARQQTWQQASMLVHTLLEGGFVNEH